MGKDTRPDGHHSKKKRLKPTKQGSKGLPDTANDNDERAETDDGLSDFFRELTRRGHKVTIRREDG